MAKSTTSIAFLGTFLDCSLFSGGQEAMQRRAALAGLDFQPQYEDDTGPEFLVGIVLAKICNLDGATSAAVDPSVFTACLYRAQRGIAILLGDADVGIPMGDDYQPMLHAVVYTRP